MYYKRNLEENIKKYLSVKETIAIVGIRQCGKTTLMKKIAQDISGEKKVNFISFDDVSILQLFEEDIDSFIQIHVKSFDFLFIDEIQYAAESGKKLKFIYDYHYIKMIISGSSAAEISIQSLKYMVGRIFTFRLYPFAFNEFLQVKDENLLQVYEKGTYKKATVSQFNKHLREFLMYGGFPRVVTAENFDEKELILKNIYNTYLLREIRETFQLPDNLKTSKLIKLLALQIGNLVNYNELSNQSDFNFSELKNILNIFEKTFIIGFIQPFFTNKRTELIKTPKVYFIDPGFRNICLENFSKTQLVQGVNIEQFIYSEFIKKDVTVKYWRTKSQAEIDFILEKNNEAIPVEVKTSLKKSKISRSFHSFMGKYKTDKGYILSENLETILKINETQQVYFLPWIKLHAAQI